MVIAESAYLLDRNGLRTAVAGKKQRPAEGTE
jgi:hypothetical protein